MTALIGFTGSRVAVCSRLLPSIGKNIRKLRVAAGYKAQGDFAIAVGVQQGRVSDWERDRYGLPDTDSLLRIAKVLGCSIDRILEGVDRGYEAVRTRSDLIRHGEGAKIEPSEGRADVPASPASDTRNLESKRYRELLGETEEIAARLLDIAGELANAELQDRSTARRESGSRRGHRKTG
jgi:transcriptional regulator with XRE-family HTH domain